MALQLLDGLWKDIQCELLVYLYTIDMQNDYERCERIGMSHCARTEFRADMKVIRGDGRTFGSYTKLGSAMTLTSVLPKRERTIAVIKGHSVDATGELWRIEGRVV